MSSKITVGKIVASSNEAGWSQAYHAGGFTAVISVTGNDSSEEKQFAHVGKELLDTLVSEYFTLTTKDLETIKQAVMTTIGKAPSKATVGLIVAAVIKNVLYAVIANEGRILLKRGDKLGLLLAVKPEDNERIASASGFLQKDDVVLLHSVAFGKIFPHEALAAAFDHKTAEELAETFAPKVHETGDGAASALVFSYHEEGEPEPVHEEKMEKSEEKLPEPEKPLSGFETPITPEKSRGFFSHRQKLFLTLTVILALVLVGSIAFFLYREQQAKQQALFQSIYQPAKSKFSEGQGLINLNRALAIEDFQAAQKTLSDAKSKFSTGSSEENQIISLLNQVTSALTDAQKVPLITAAKAQSGASPLLEFAAKHQGAFITQDSTNFYTADNSAITQYDKKTTTAKKLVTNSNDWQKIGGFDTYFGNFYIADTADGIDKFASGSYAKSAYFADGVKPDLSNVVSISIDSSIWVLTSDGTLTKYTKGAQDSLSVTGLDKPLSSPTQVLTSADLNNVYILDKGNERVVVLKKDGSFVAQYASDTVRTANMIDVSEKNKEIYLLSDNTVYQLDLK